MRRYLNYAVVMLTAAVLALALPSALFANVSGTQTLNSMQAFSLDTGAIASNGSGDILFTGAGISFVGSATGFNLATDGYTGSSGFSTVTGSSTILQGLPPTSFANAPITSSALAPNTIVGYKTNGGNLGAFLITAASGSTSVTFQYVTFESTTPTITGVLNNYGLTPPGFSNSGIAPGTLFIVKGSNLSTIATATLQNPAAPGLPNTLGGATVTVTVGAATTQPVFYYAESTQLALVMPSNTPAGSGTVTVKMNGQTSNAYPITVVAGNFGMLSTDQTGDGSVKAVNPNTPANPYISFTNPAPPGEIVSIYGSGLGADPTRDTEFSQTTNFPFTIGGLSAFYVGGMPVTIQYQGASGYPGLNQVNIVLPGNVPTGCFVSIVGVTASGVPTNFLTMPIGNGTCQDPGLGYTGSMLTSLGGQTTVNTGVVDIDYLSTPLPTGTQVTQQASATFLQFTGGSYGSSNDAAVSIGGCVVNESLLTAAPTTTSTPLNPGTITVTSPNAGISPAQLSANPFAAGGYLAQLPSGFLTDSGGTFQIGATAGTTPPAVGAFATQVVFPTPLLTWTNQAADATVVRSSGLTVTWSGGAPGTHVSIGGTAIDSLTDGFFICLAPVAVGTFTVPPYVLAALPAGNKVDLSVANYSAPQSFAASGIDYGYAQGSIAYAINATLQ